MEMLVGGLGDSGNCLFLLDMYPQTVEVQVLIHERPVTYFLMARKLLKSHGLSQRGVLCFTECVKGRTQRC